jgi:predicted NAD/FAD-dependent oxidoreductase
MVLSEAVLQSKVAIIGAGMAGLAAARRLSAARIAVSLFDKGRGIGGRAATRRAEGWHFDHGLRFIDAAGPAFAQLVAEWQQDGVVTGWGDDRLTIGVPSMNAPFRALQNDLSVQSSCQISALDREKQGWRLIAAEPMSSPEGSFDAVILAVPAPQVGPLALTASVQFEGLGSVRYAPCWTVMLGFDQPLDLPPYRRGDGTIAWMSREASKPGRPSDKEAVVIQASAEWSRRHLELPAEEIIELLSWESGLMATPILAIAHRWRYALVEQPAGQPCLWDPASRIGACGDWCMGPGLEAAFLSGEAMADRLLRGGLA